MNLAKIKPQNNLYHLRKFPRGIVLSLVILTGVFLGRAQSVANADFPVKTNTSVFTWSNPLPFQYRIPASSAMVILATWFLPCGRFAAGIRSILMIRAMAHRLALRCIRPRILRTGSLKTGW